MYSRGEGLDTLLEVPVVDVALESGMAHHGTYGVGQMIVYQDVVVQILDRPILIVHPLL